MLDQREKIRRHSSLLNSLSNTRILGIFLPFLAFDDSPQGRAGPAGPNKPMIYAINRMSSDMTSVSMMPDHQSSFYDKKNPNVPVSSYALMEDKGVRTNIGNTKFVMGLLSEFWLFNIFFILGGTFLMTFYLPQFYIDDELWNVGCYWKLCKLFMARDLINIVWLFPLPYTLICFFGLALPFRTPKFIYDGSLPKRRCDNLYILTVTKGDNREVILKITISLIATGCVSVLERSQASGKIAPMCSCACSHG